MKYCFVIEPVMKRKRRIQVSFTISRFSDTRRTKQKFSFFPFCFAINTSRTFTTSVYRLFVRSSIANHRHCVPMDIFRTVSGDVVRFEQGTVLSTCEQNATGVYADGCVVRRKQHGETTENVRRIVRQKTSSERNAANRKPNVTAVTTTAPSTGYLDTDHVYTT